MAGERVHFYYVVFYKRDPDFIIVEWVANCLQNRKAIREYNGFNLVPLY